MTLKVSSLKVRVEDKQILKGIDLIINSGEVVALMGPNGSGKSSLAYSLMGHPGYEVLKGKMSLDGTSLVGKSIERRAKMGLFLAWQNPLAVEGVRVREVLLSVMRKRDEKISALEVKEQVEGVALELGIEGELLERGLNEGFSGGERKKMEILQMRMLRPKYAVLDEIDSGLDLDALKKVGRVVGQMVKEGLGVLLITHNSRMFKYLKPNKVLVMKGGRVVVRGKEEVVKKLENGGYEKIAVKADEKE